jgi:hypothetical protein
MTDPRLGPDCPKKLVLEIINELSTRGYQQNFLKILVVVLRAEAKQAPQTSNQEHGRK